MWSMRDYGEYFHRTVDDDCVLLRIGLSSGTPASNSASDVLQTDNEASSQDSEHDRKHDVFISYRRQTGKHLAGSVRLFDACRIGCGKYLCNGRVSVRPPVCPVGRQRQRPGLLLTGYRSIYAACRSPGRVRHISVDIAAGAKVRSAASVNAVIRGGSTQTCLFRCLSE